MSQCCSKVREVCVFVLTHGILNMAVKLTRQGNLKFYESINQHGNYNLCEGLMCWWFLVPANMSLICAHSMALQQTFIGFWFRKYFWNTEGKCFGERMIVFLRFKLCQKLYMSPGRKWCYGHIIQWSKCFSGRKWSGASVVEVSHGFEMCLKFDPSIVTTWCMRQPAIPPPHLCHVYVKNKSYKVMQLLLLVY